MGDNNFKSFLPGGKGKLQEIEPESIIPAPKKLDAETFGESDLFLSAEKGIHTTISGIKVTVGSLIHNLGFIHGLQNELFSFNIRPNPKFFEINSRIKPEYLPIIIELIKDEEGLKGSDLGISILNIQKVDNVVFINYGWEGGNSNYIYDVITPSVGPFVEKFNAQLVKQEKRIENLISC